MALEPRPRAARRVLAGRYRLLERIDEGGAGEVKRANVIVDPRGIAKLTDFGIARAARDKDEQELLGTARYIAPERVEGGEVTAQTDVYGIGLLAYELLACQPVFEGRSSEELVRKRLLGPPPSLRNRRIGVD